MSQDLPSSLLRFRMSTDLQALSGDTTFWIVAMNLDVVAGYAVWGGNDPDRFLAINESLVVVPNLSRLLGALSAAADHSFEGDERFSTFCRRIQSINLMDERAVDAECGLFDFNATMVALRERDVLTAPYSGMAVDCLDAAYDLGRQYGEDSAGYQLVRSEPLNVLYRVIWGDVPERQLDYFASEIAFAQLINWIERLTRPGNGNS